MEPCVFSRTPSSVLVVADTAGGVLDGSLELARVLCRRGVRVSLAVLGGPIPAAQRAEARRVPDLALHEATFRLEWLDEPWDDVARAGEWLLEIEQRVRPDVVHLHDPAHGALPFRAPRVVVSCGSVLAWHRALIGTEAPARWNVYRHAAAVGLAAADALAAPTRAMLEAACREHGPHPRARVVPWGRDPERYRPAPKEPFVLAVGDAGDPTGNVAALDAVAPGLPWPLRVARAESSPESLRRPLAGAEAIGSFPPDGIAEAMGRAAIFAQVARYEPLGLAVLEAALAGCALVLADVPVLRELWGGVAFFVDPTDPVDLRRALICLAEHAGVRDALAARSRSRALGFSPERMALGYLSLYAELPPRPARPSDRPSPSLSAPPPPKPARPSEQP